MTDYVRKVAHATSVKEIMIVEEPTATAHGIADFKFRPVFSVFDYGTIQPTIPLDNSTICLMQGFNFEYLREQGVESHYMGLVTKQGELISAKEAISRRIAPDTVRVRFVNRVMPEFVEEGEGDEKKGSWDYSAFEDPAANNYVHPLELISRNEFPESSSVWTRVAEGQITLQDLGLSADYKKGDPVPEELIPILDYSTKFEKEDRYLSPEQARLLAGLTASRFARLNETTRNASRLMTSFAASRGFSRKDGKVEQVTYVRDGKQVDELGDAVCTWHEDKIGTKFELGVSKQRIRDKVKKLNPKWYAEIQRAKKQAQDEGVDDFTKLMDPSIEYTSPSAEFFEAVNVLFRAATNQWVDARVFEVYNGRHESMEKNLERAVGDFKKVA